MHDILCIYYSRSGNTRAAAEEIAAALDAELAEITDAQDRSGLKGYFRSGLDAMRRTVQPIDPLQTERPLTDYRLVILASPVWAGRCASPVRALLKERGGELPRVGYVLTRAGSRKYEEIYGQMDRYLPAEHQLAVSLRPESEGYDFWLGDFVQNVQRLLAE